MDIVAEITNSPDRADIGLRCLYVTQENVSERHKVRKGEQNEGLQEE